jgi:hypothetical protein
MHEHRSEKGHKLTAHVGKEAAGNERPLHYEGIAAAELHKEKEHIQHDQNVRNSRYNSSSAVVITDW